MTRWNNKLKPIRLLPMALGMSLLVAPVQAYGAVPVFHNSVEYIAGSQMVDVKSHDVNGDGITDLIAIENTANQIAVWLGNGDGTFQEKKTTRTGGNPQDVAFTDFDQDGITDLAVIDMGSSRLNKMRGRGDGTFGNPTIWTGLSQPVSVAAADLNGDELADFVIAHYDSGFIRVLISQSDGSVNIDFTKQVGMHPRDIVAKDFNGDGHTDIAVANHGSNTVSVLLGDGSGTLSDPKTFPSGRSPLGLQAADINSDGKLDLALAAKGDGAANVFLGKGDGTFENRVSYLLGDSPIDIQVGDFNGDGIMDLASALENSDLSLLLGKPDGTFEVAVNYPYQASALSSSDYNGDGKADIAFVNGTKLHVLNSAAEGTLAFGSDRYEASEDSGSVTVAVYRTNGTYGQTQVRMETFDGTAIAGTDYTAVDTLLVFNEGETSKTYHIPTVRNAVFQGDRTFSVRLSSPTNGATLGTVTTASVAILEDDEAPDTTAPIVNVSNFDAIDNYNGTPDRLHGNAGAIGEAGARVKAYPWIDADGDGIVDAGELGAAIALGTSAVDGSVPGADTGDLEPGTYAFVIGATDAAGNESALDAAAAVRVTLTKADAPDITAPTWPTGDGLTFSGVSTGAVTLAWPAASDNVVIASYEIYRGGVRLTSVPFTSLSYTATGLTADTTYAFAIKALDAAGNGSSEVAGTVRTAASSGASGSFSPFFSSESRLKELTLTAGGKPLAMTPRFQLGVRAYAATTQEAQVVLSFGAMHTAAIIEVEGQTISGGSYTAFLKEGDNEITIRVQAEEGVSHTIYKLILKREASSKESGEKPGTKEITEAIPFQDIKGHWAEADIRTAFKLGIAKGRSNGTFEPNAPVSRAEWIVMMQRLLQDETGAEPTFSDSATIPAWAKNAVSAAAAQGYVTGYSDGAFRPGQAVTRVEAAAMTVRAMKWTPHAGAATTFVDDADIPKWAKSLVQIAVDHGILLGQRFNRFAPDKSSTRAEAAVLLVRVSEKLGR